MKQAAGRIISVIIGVVVVAALAGVVAKRKQQLKAAPAYGDRPVPVRVAEVTQGALEMAHDYLGIVESWQQAAISSRASARVEGVFFHEGDPVKAGDVLLQLDEQDLLDERNAMESQILAAEATLISMEANLTYWRNEQARDKKLQDQGVIPPSASEATVNRLAGAEAQLLAARENRQAMMHRRDAVSSKLTYMKLTSPFDGVITRRDVDPGDLATPGRPLLVVEQRDRLKLVFDAPQEDMALMAKGLPVRIHVGGKALDATLSHLYPSLDTARMVRAEVVLPADAALQIGAYVPLTVILERHEKAVVIPGDSLMENSEGQTMVFVVSDGKLEARPVTVKTASGGRVSVAGVMPGEQVVTSTFLGWATLASGLTVEVLR